ncbi:MAG: ABC transporter substrate-binding protein [Candidatus Eremiobacteraeota bacterium]|nr:ABC transporter substrate-binding protein [Candidatus Eremiobacteraeota bacterium]
MRLCRRFAAFCAAAQLCALGCAPRAAGPATSDAQRPRIVSLAPSLTEMVYAVGAGAELVGDTKYDDYPAAAVRLPHVADLSSVDLERLAALRPTLVLALHDQEREGGQIEERLRVPVRYLPNRSLHDLFSDITQVGSLCRRSAQAQALSDSLRERIHRIAARAPRGRHKPRVFFLLGLPGFTAGKNSFINDLIELAGGTNIAAGVDQPYPDLSAEAIVRADPQVIIVAGDTPFGVDDRRREPWRSCSAVRRGAVLRPPNDDLLERNGPRVAVGLQWLADVIKRYGR